MAIGRTNSCVGGGTVVEVDIPLREATISKVSSPTPLSVARDELAATTVGNYGLFGGGGFSNGSTSATVDAYDTNLTRTTPTPLSVARKELAATTVGNYGLFGGGSTSATVDAYDTNLTRTTPTPLSLDRYELAATTVGGYALFGGGSYISYNGYATATVDAYDTNLTRTSPTPLSVARDTLTATTVGNYGLFGGGASSATVDAYDTNLTRTSPTPLSVARDMLTSTTATSVKNEPLGMFCGGNSPDDKSNVVDVYDKNLMRTTSSPLSEARYSAVTATIGTNALVCGGYGGYSIECLATVDAYKADISMLTLIYPLCDSTAEYNLNGQKGQVSTPTEVTLDTPIKGYIKYKSRIKYQ